MKVPGLKFFQLFLAVLIEYFDLVILHQVGFLLVTLSLPLQFV